MSNPLFGGSNGPIQNGSNMFGPFGNMMNFMNQFNQFRSNLSGNPQQMVQQMLQSGQMSQEQFNQLSGIANQSMPLIKQWEQLYGIKR